MTLTLLPVDAIKAMIIAVAIWGLLVILFELISQSFSDNEHKEKSVVKSQSRQLPSDAAIPDGGGKWYRYVGYFDQGKIVFYATDDEEAQKKAKKIMIQAVNNGRIPLTIYNTWEELTNE